MKDIVNIVLCYRNENEVITYARKIEGLNNYIKLDLVVVVNATGEMTETEFERRLNELNLNIVIFRPKENLGYMNGLLFGYREYEKQEKDIVRYVIMSNTDIDFKDSNFINDLLTSNYPTDVACIGPSICVNELESYDNPVAYHRRTISEINRLIRKFSFPVFNQLYVWLAFIKPRFIKRKKELKSGKVYEVHGCFFILTGKFAHEIKDEYFGPLMYSEETFIAENVYVRGACEYYDSKLEVVHLEHTVTSRLKAKKRAQYMNESMRWIKDQFYK